MCLKRKKNQYILQGFFLLDGVLEHEPRIPKRTSGHLGCSFFFFWCPEVKLEFQKKRCPEVRLGILDFTFRDRTEGGIQSS